MNDGVEMVKMYESTWCGRNHECVEVTAVVRD